ncbi:MAG: ferrous iron transport protein A [Alphaproteobacteria bacterium]|nr:ferrous iron transport protein A [Alphaproteobacteria bacterium]
MHKESVTLTSLPRGTRARISALSSDDTLQRRMLTMGIIEGAEVEIIHEGLIGRDPIALRVDDRMIALRRSEAATIHVQRIALAS